MTSGLRLLKLETNLLLQLLQVYNRFTALWDYLGEPVPER